MTDQSKTTTGAKAKTQDYISQLKKETEGVKDSRANEQDELEWDTHVEEEEETPQQKKKGVVVQQGTVTSDKPKKLGDLFSDSKAQQTRGPGQGKSFKPREG